MQYIICNNNMAISLVYFLKECLQQRNLDISVNANSLMLGRTLRKEIVLYFKMIQNYVVYQITKKNLTIDSPLKHLKSESRLMMAHWIRVTFMVTYYLFI